HVDAVELLLRSIHRCQLLTRRELRCTRRVVEATDQLRSAKGLGDEVLVTGFDDLPTPYAPADVSLASYTGIDTWHVTLLHLQGFTNVVHWPQGHNEHCGLFLSQHLVEQVMQALGMKQQELSLAALVHL